MLKHGSTKMPQPSQNDVRINFSLRRYQVLNDDLTVDTLKAATIAQSPMDQCAPGLNSDRIAKPWPSERGFAVSASTNACFASALV
jgi:hypothetical protein